MWRERDEEEKRKLEPTRCPVCKAVLGKRDIEMIFAAHCEECKAVFYWRPWAEIPTVTLDRNAPVRCGCGGCGR